MESISAKGDPSKKVTYGQLVGGKKFNLTLDPKAKRKPPSEWTVLGTPAQRPDIPAIVTGQFEFVHNVRVPGMLHGRVVRPPAVGATVMSVDESSVAGMPGLVKVVVKKNFVGVVAEKPWQALQAAEQTEGHVDVRAAGCRTQADFYEQLRNQKPTRDILLVDSKDVEQKLGQAAAVVKATYLHPYQMHGSMGSSCAVADVQGDKATIWSPTQGVWYQRSTAAMVLGLKPENVHVIFRRGSGCYGLNGADTVTYDAALLSQAVGKPVRVQLTRKDEMAWENYGNAFLMDERAGLDAQGNIIAWDHEAWSPTLGNRPGPGTPGNVITGSLVGFQPEAFTPRSPAPEPRGFNNNSNGIPSYAAALFDGVPKGAGNGAQRARAGSQRSVAVLDRPAAIARAPPEHVRARILHGRTGGARQGRPGGISPAPFEQPARDRRAEGRGESGQLGRAAIAAARQRAKRASPPAAAWLASPTKGDNGYTAIVAEVEVDQDTGKIAVKRVVRRRSTPARSRIPTA